ncbi:MAG: hypothetical protein CM1200mP1_07380 [Candidatus Neomarinimicrobiota bacterium]|nr:MAG: hypothetical protein CM1200mP1_07380 [Candidatus Neomarinimicrobiota bacterium]
MQILGFIGSMVRCGVVIKLRGGLWDWMVIEKYYPKIISLIFIIFGLLNINDPDGFFWLVHIFSSP